MAAELIGLAECWNPKCRSKRARVSLSKSVLPVMTCNACNFQGFARGDLSDEGMRGSIVARAPAADPAPAQPALLPPAPPPAAPAAAPVPKKPEAPPPKRAGWGFLTA